jgi:hypothetical protein
MLRRVVPLLALALLATTRAAKAEEPATQAAPAPTQPEPADKPEASFRISGLVYADYYYVAENHREELEGRNGFWLRRVYLTYDHTLAKAFTLRVRLEANSEGDFESTGIQAVYLKDAWLRWSRGGHALTFGLSPTPHIEFVEAFQGYRSIEKTPFDLYRWDTSRDMGLAWQGRFGRTQATSAALSFGNGSGNGSEVDASKTVRGQLAHRFASGLSLEGYADWQDQPDGGDISTLEAFLGWKVKRWRASLQYGWQRRRAAGADGSPLELEFLSGFATLELRPKLAAVARLDYNFDPVPDGETIDYLPFAETARALLGYAALDVTFARNVHLIPNVEWITYRHAEGETPASDLVPRVTLFFSW